MGGGGERDKEAMPKDEQPIAMEMLGLCGCCEGAVVMRGSQLD